MSIGPSNSHHSLISQTGKNNAKITLKDLNKDMLYSIGATDTGKAEIQLKNQPKIYAQISQNNDGGVAPRTNLIGTDEALIVYTEPPNYAFGNGFLVEGNSLKYLGEETKVFEVVYSQRVQSNSAVLPQLRFYTYINGSKVGFLPGYLLYCDSGGIGVSTFSFQVGLKQNETLKLAVSSPAGGTFVDTWYWTTTIHEI